MLCEKWNPSVVCCILCSDIFGYQIKPATARNINLYIYTRSIHVKSIHTSHSPIGLSVCSSGTQFTYDSTKVLWKLRKIIIILNKTVDRTRHNIFIVLFNTVFESLFFQPFGKTFLFSDFYTTSNPIKSFVSIRCVDIFCEAFFFEVNYS